MRFRELAAATLLILAILMPLSLRTRVPPLTEFDQKFYVGIAYDLRHEGRFTNGYLFDDTPDGQERPAGMQFSPIYPGLLALAAWLDPAFDRAIACQAESRGTNQACPDGARLVRGAQLAMLVGFFLLVWRIGTDVGGSRRIGWITLILALVTGGVLVRTGIYAMTETTTLLLSTAATLAAIAAIRGRHRVTWTILTGVLLSLTALTRPAFLYAYFAACLLGVIVAAWRPDRRRGLALIAVFAMSAAATMAPWIVRNTVQLGHPAITFGYDSRVLVQRLAFNRMTPREYALSYLCWFPDGNGLANTLVGPHACDRFNWEETPDSFYSIGNHEFMAETLAAAGGPDHHLAYLLSHELLPQPVKHALVTLPLALRGAWIDHYWGLLLMPMCLVVTIGAIRRRDPALLALTLPAWFMLLFNAAVAVNQTRYNLMLIPPFAVSGALFVDRLAVRFGGVRGRAMADRSAIAPPRG